MSDTIMSGPFQPTMESLRTFTCPEWFRDAKFGIWSHWGPQAVPMFGDWYARNMYIEGSDQYRFHWRTYGHPSKFGYKDIAKLWKAENFDPEGLMQLYVNAGARYFVGQAMHHDNFDNFDSAHNPWNSTKVGPMKDISMLWKQAAAKHGLPFGVSEHLGASYTWMETSHRSDKQGPYAGIPYDGADPAFESLYRDNNSEYLDFADKTPLWYTSNEKYHINWFNRIKDVIDKLEPDLLYSDGGLPFGEYGQKIVAHLYNASAARNGGKNQAVYNQKNTDPAMYKVGVLDIERGITDDILGDPWQDDTSIGDWFYNVKDVYKTAEDVVDTLVDIVSKNGNLLLNVTQKPDGTIDDEARYALEKIGAWMKDNGDGVYSTRPYKFATEGGTKLEAGAFNEGSASWTGKDFRFTTKPGSVYAFQMRNDGGEKANIRSLGRNSEGQVKAVSVAGRAVSFEQRDGALVVDVPANPHRGMPVCIRVDF
ncbi:MAG: alpha-L-fucosidase [Oscillospiraceae bacterium]